MNYVIRVGDQDDYHLLFSSEEVAEHLAERGIYEIVPMAGRFGVEADRYTGQNYISLYRTGITDESQIGKPGDNPVALSAKIISGIRRKLAKLLGELDAEEAAESAYERGSRG